MTYGMGDSALTAVRDIHGTDDRDLRLDRTRLRTTHLGHVVVSDVQTLPRNPVIVQAHRPGAGTSRLREAQIGVADALRFIANARKDTQGARW
jgi:hypothetical protein